MNHSDTLTDNQGQIRFGVICNGPVFQSWQANCLEQLLRLDHVEASLLIVEKGCASTSENPSGLRLRNALYRIYSWLFVHGESSRRRDLTTALSGAQVLYCSTDDKDGRQYLSESDTDQIRSHCLDFILKFSPGAVRSGILDSARHGVWSFHHGDEGEYRGQPPAFWEIYTGEHVTSSTLRRLTDDPDRSIVLKQGFFGTIQHSYAKNLDNVRMESTEWPAQICTALLGGRETQLNAPPTTTTAPIRNEPNSIQTVLFALKLARNLGARIYHGLFRHDQWAVGIANTRIQAFLEPGARPTVKYLEPKANNGYLSDPFGFYHENQLTVLCENYDFQSLEAEISSFQVEGGDPISPLVPAMPLPVHGSYPYIIEHEGKVYCTPETYGAREVGLYEADKTLESWTKVATLVEGVTAVDPTVFQHDGLWWLICGDGEREALLWIWYAQDLHGPWISHAANPVKADIRSSRPAGTPFLHDGVLFRPAQDCSKIYGGRITINRVKTLTPDRFEEEPAATVEPYLDSAYPVGIHTISAVGDVTLLDGKRYIFIGAAFRRKILRRISLGPVFRKLHVPGF